MDDCEKYVGRRALGKNKGKGIKDKGRDRGSCSWRGNDFRRSARLLSFNTFQWFDTLTMSGLILIPLRSPTTAADQIVLPLRSVQVVSGKDMFVGVTAPWMGIAAGKTSRARKNSLLFLLTTHLWTSV